MILVLGLNPALDIYAEADSLIFDEPLRLMNIMEQAGGKGTNVSRTLHALRVPHVLLTLGGTEDSFSRLLEQEKLPVRVVASPSPVRTNHSILIKDRGRVLKINQPGSTLGTAQWQELRTHLRDLAARADHIFLSGSVAPGLPQEELIQELSRLGQHCRLSADTTPEILSRLSAQVELFSILPNRHEAELIAGHGLADTETMLDWLRAKRARVEHPLVTDGAQGVWFLDEQGQLGHKPALQTQVISTVGAGDAFAGGWLAGLDRGQEKDHCLDLALEQAALACARKGN